MTDQQLGSQYYCEICGIDVRQDTELKRFGKLFCSEEHMEQYVKARQSQMGLDREGRERRRFRVGC